MTTTYELTEYKTFETETIADLVVAAQDGDRQAFSRLFEHYQKMVLAVAYRRLGSEAEAQELCQEVFIQAMRKIGQLDDPACFGGWLRAVASRMAINRAVRSRPLVALEAEQVESTCGDHETPLGRMLASERSDCLHSGLGRLPEMDRNTLVAFYFEGQSLVEMSDQFASPVGTIKRRLHVARKRLAKELACLA